MRGKVLIADDDEGVLAFVAETLKNNGVIEVLMARDGEEALKIAQQEKPDVIFLDVLMPKKNGYEVCLDLKRDPATARWSCSLALIRILTDGRLSTISELTTISPSLAALLRYTKNIWRCWLDARQGQVNQNQSGKTVAEAPVRLPLRGSNARFKGLYSRVTHGPRLAI